MSLEQLALLFPAQRMSRRDDCNQLDNGPRSSVDAELGDDSFGAVASGVVAGAFPRRVAGAFPRRLSRVYGDQ